MSHITLVGGPKDGFTIQRQTCAFYVFPGTRPNDDGSDLTLVDWKYDHNGRYLGETIRTTTWNADYYRDTMEWLDRKDQRIEDLESENARLRALLDEQD